MKNVRKLLFYGWPWYGKTNLEHSKLIIDLLKHQSTLCAGSIVAVVTFYEKFASRHFTALVGFALVSFVLSIISSVLAQSNMIDLLSDQRSKESRIIAIATGVEMLISWASFVFAMGALTLYGVLNLVLT